MRPLLRWLVVTLGIAAFVRWLRHRREAPVPMEPVALEDPADELRRKLAESRALHEEPAEPAPASGAAAEPSVDERRAAVHAQGKDALADMTSSAES